jgi:hypothetical protein
MKKTARNPAGFVLVSNEGTSMNISINVLNRFQTDGKWEMSGKIIGALTCASKAARSQLGRFLAFKSAAILRAALN